MKLLIEFLMEQEGFSPVWYRDGPCWAIGYGHHSCTPDRSIEPISEQEARVLLERDIQAAAERAGEEFSELEGYPIAWLPERLRMALTELVFNTGSLKGWPRFVRAVSQGDILRAIKESRRYYRVGGQRVYMAKRTRAFITTFLLPELGRTGPKLGIWLVAGWPIWLAMAREWLEARKE